MPTYTVKLKDRREVAEGTMAFWFEKPAGFSDRAGQYLVLGLIDPPERDHRSSRRALSIPSAPFENEIMLAMRMRDSAFKRVLKALPLGSEVTIDGPFGEFDLPTDPSQPAVFLAGGIGITPFRSLAKQATRDRLAQRIDLFYSNRRPEEAAFLDELKAIERENPNYRLIATMTQAAKSNRPWSGETGYINPEMLARYLPDPQSPIYYIAGPPTMANAMRGMLDEVGVSVGNIRVELFSGY